MLLRRLDDWLRERYREVEYVPVRPASIDEVPEELQRKLIAQGRADGYAAGRAALLEEFAAHRAAEWVQARRRMRWRIGIGLAVGAAAWCLATYVLIPWLSADPIEALDSFFAVYLLIPAYFGPLLLIQFAESTRRTRHVVRAVYVLAIIGLGIWAYLQAAPFDMGATVVIGAAGGVLAILVDYFTPQRGSADGVASALAPEASVDAAG